MPKRTRSRQRYGGDDPDLSADTSSSIFTPPSMGGRTRSGGAPNVATTSAEPTTSAKTDSTLNNMWNSALKAYSAKGGRKRSRKRTMTMARTRARTRTRSRSFAGGRRRRTRKSRK